MAKIDFNAALNAVKNGGDNSNAPRFGYFSLKNDGDEAIVRFMHDSPEDFDIVDVHPYQVNGRYRNINCLTTPTGPVDACPLCGNPDVRRIRKIYVHLIQYTADETGHIVATPRIWERPFKFAEYLASLCAEYGPLSELIFKVKRHGKAGDMQTTYDVLYANPTFYKPEIYVKLSDAFNEYNPIGTNVYDMTAEAMINLLNPEAVQADTSLTYEEPAVPATPRTYQPAPAAPAAARTYVPETPRAPMTPNTQATEPVTTARRLPF